MIDEINYKSKTMNRNIRIWVYNPNPNKALPVIYMHDGQNLFDKKLASYGKIWNVDKHLKDNNLEFIVVGIDSAVGGHERMFEYSTHKSERTIKNYGLTPEIGGRGKIYLDEIVNVIKPMIDEKYNTLSDKKNTAMIGSSMGGVITLAALIDYNKWFSKFGCVSNAFWFSDQAIYEDCKNFKGDNESRIHFDCGGKESDDDSTNAIYIETNEKIKNEILKKVIGRYQFFNNGIHSEECWSDRFTDIVEYLFCLGQYEGD